MQNENQTPATPSKKFLGLLVTGILLLVVGFIFLKEANLQRTDRSWVGLRFETLIFASPLMLALGAGMLLVGVFRFIRRFVNFGSVISPNQAIHFAKAWRVCIWVVAGATIFPWWWLGILTRLNGGRPGNEGEGMGGALITMFFGMPALALAIFNEVRLRRNRSKKR